MRIYDVELVVLGPILIRRSISFNTDKELYLGNIFNSAVNIKPHPHGIKISSTVSTTDQDRAFKIALLFIGRMLDVLSMRINSPLSVTNNKIKNVSDSTTVRALIQGEEFRLCFELARILNLNQTTLLRALNWYRKGLYTEDPFDKFLAFWNSINVIAAKYHTTSTITQRGIINQIRDCFLTLWGDNINQ